MPIYPRDNFIEFISQKNFLPGEGFTIAYGWDKGIVLTAVTVQKAHLDDEPCPELGLYPAARFMHYYDNPVGCAYRERPEGSESVTVMYSPPQFDTRPLSPARSAHGRRNLDPRDITATIVGLAIRGISRSRRQRKRD